ncbi:MAG: hypothetical protein C4562_01730 [Actinobacteria bacterium]|nr:MAG: hypothetical protein C4562_01730 [Actinomycetota bacterium]
MTISKEVSNLTGFPKLPKPLIKLFLKAPWLVPVRIRWKVASKGIGLLMTAVTGKDDSLSMSCKELGLRQAKALKDSLQVGSSLKEVMQVIRLANRLFGTKHTFKMINPTTSRTLVKKCAWAGSDTWGQKACATLSAYEIGLAEGLNDKVKIRFITKMAKGDSVCQAEYTLNQ